MKNFIFLLLFVAATVNAQTNNDSLDLILEKNWKFRKWNISSNRLDWKRDRGNFKILNNYEWYQNHR